MPDRLHTAFQYLKLDRPLSAKYHGPVHKRLKTQELQAAADWTNGCGSSELGLGNFGGCQNIGLPLATGLGSSGQGLPFCASLRNGKARSELRMRIRKRKGGGESTLLGMHGVVKRSKSAALEIELA